MKRVYNKWGYRHLLEWCRCSRQIQYKKGIGRVACQCGKE